MWWLLTLILALSAFMMWTGLNPQLSFLAMSEKVTANTKQDIPATEGTQSVQTSC